MITNVNTENLASLVIDQVAAPGSPHVYSSESTPIDMQTGVINYNAPEVPFICAATGQMAKRYNLPCMVAGWGSNANSKPGIMTAFSELAGCAMSILAETDLAAGMGSIDVAKGCSYEQLVIDAYLWEHFRSFKRDFTINEATIALDVVKEVGHGKTFLTHPHTAKNFKKELFFFNKEKLAWEATLSNRMVPEARKIAKKLLKEHEVPQIDRDIIKQGDELIREYEKILGT
jgi:trimethylamine--corrinoid protein Co-methyltransferase